MSRPLCSSSMLSREIRVLDFDGSVIKQRNLLARYPHQVIPLQDLGPRARFWMNSRTHAQIRERIGREGRNSVTFLGSGDFHQVSPILLSRFEEPVSLIVFDLHPDWDTLPPRFGCGSWVTEALRSGNIRKCVLAGIGSEDISSPGIQSGNLAALGADRLEIYPYHHAPTRVFLRTVPANISLKAQRSFLRTKIYWDDLRSKDLGEFFRRLISRLPSKKAYISIDKDCLRNEYALTNWEEGRLSLDELILMLKALKEGLEIAGLDITGEYSEIAVAGRLKGVFSRLDHPRAVRAAKLLPEEVNAVNESTNLKILEALFR